MTRWDDIYPDDTRVLSAPPSQCAKSAATEFLSRGKRLILDLGCGVGRDTFFLESQGLTIVGVDASRVGLRIARQIKSEQRAKSQMIAADARRAPFKDGSFEGVYCFGLLHEFTSQHREIDVREVMSEIRRLLQHGGILVLAVLKGDPEEGLPHVQLFTQRMFENATIGLRPIHIEPYNDVGCTGRTDYHIWYGVFEERGNTV